MVVYAHLPLQAGFHFLKQSLKITRRSRRYKCCLKSSLAPQAIDIVDEFLAFEWETALLEMEWPPHLMIYRIDHESQLNGNNSCIQKGGNIEKLKRTKANLDTAGNDLVSNRVSIIYQQGVWGDLICKYWDQNWGGWVMEGPDWRPPRHADRLLIF